MEPTLKHIIERADALYAARENLKNIHSSVAILKDLAPTDYESGWRLGQCYFFLGQETQSQDKSIAYYGQGIRASARAVRLAPLRVEGHFWLGVNLALKAKSSNALVALGLAWLAKRSLRRAVRLDPSYHAAGPLRVLARVQHKLPFLAGGGRARARASFERALQLAPENSVTRIYFAELLMDTGDKIEAKKQLEAILSGKPDPAWAFETKRDRKLARELLAGLGG